MKSKIVVTSNLILRRETKETEKEGEPLQKPKKKAKDELFTIIEQWIGGNFNG